MQLILAPLVLYLLLILALAYILYPHIKPNARSSDPIRALLFISLAVIAFGFTWLNMLRYFTWSKAYAGTRSDLLQYLLAC